jgi:GNAT superfamily N-acetyltransferase
MRATRTYLQLTSRDAFAPAFVQDPSVRVERVIECPPSFYRYLYTEVGRRHHWTDRLGWSDEEIAAHLAKPDLSLWLMSAGGAPAGFFELAGDGEGGVELAYFGLLDTFHGRRLGGHLLSIAVEEAWRANPRRVWLHTCTLDHPAALPNYLARGFAPFKTEDYEVGSA